jgi:hypothetical protein
MARGNKFPPAEKVKNYRWYIEGDEFFKIPLQAGAQAGAIAGAAK